MSIPGILVHSFLNMQTIELSDNAVASVLPDQAESLAEEKAIARGLVTGLLVAIPVNRRSKISLTVSLDPDRRLRVSALSDPPVIRAWLLQDSQEDVGDLVCEADWRSFPFDVSLL
jgi:hypothetical protein